MSSISLGRSKLKKVLLIIIGTISLIFGIIGIIMPVLPTTPFLLLSMACYTKSSDRMYSFIIKNTYLAPYVEYYIDGKGIPAKEKKKAIALIWITIGISIIFFIDLQIVKILLLAIAISVSTYIWTRPFAN